MTSDRWQQIERYIMRRWRARRRSARSFWRRLARDEVLRHQVAALLAAPPTVDGVSGPAIAAVGELVARAGLSQRDVIEFLREENRVLKRQLHGRRLQVCDDERRRVAVLGERLGRRVLAEVTSLVTPETILRWHRELIARKWRTDHHATDAPACRLKSGGSWSGWRWRIRVGATRASKVRLRTLVILWRERRSRES
jgi:hypothetical protein